MKFLGFLIFIIALANGNLFIATCAYLVYEFSGGMFKEMMLQRALQRYVAKS